MFLCKNSEYGFLFSAITFLFLTINNNDCIQFQIKLRGRLSRSCEQTDLTAHCWNTINLTCRTIRATMLSDANRSNRIVPYVNMRVQILPANKDDLHTGVVSQDCYS